jgi:hypothetical protein
MNTSDALQARKQARAAHSRKFSRSGEVRRSAGGGLAYWSETEEGLAGRGYLRLLECRSADQNGEGR